jgi:hypothetical protein
MELVGDECSVFIYILRLEMEKLLHVFVIVPSLFRILW